MLRIYSITSRDIISAREGTRGGLGFAPTHPKKIKIKLW